MAYRKAPLIVPEGGTGQVTLTSHGVLVGNGTGTVSQTAAATTGQVLTGVTAGDPVWGNGGWVLIQTQNISNVATLSFTTGITSTYDCYVFIWRNVIPVSNATLRMQVSIDGGSNYIATGYQAGMQTNVYNSATVANTGSTTLIPLTGTNITTALFGASGTLYMYGVSSGQNFEYSGHGSFYNSTPAAVMATYGGNCVAASVNAFQFTMSTGNLNTGNISLYGIRQ